MLRKLAGLAAGLLFLCSLGAQEPPPFLETIIVDVKQDKIDQYVALQREFNALAQKAGMKQRTIWQVAMGPTSQFRLTRPVESLEEYDQEGWFAKAFEDAGQAANWVGRVTECVAHRQVWVSRLSPEMAIPTEDGAPPKNLLIHVAVNLSTKMGEYRSFLAEEVFPAYKKAGAKGILAMQRVLGGNQRMFLISRGFDKWADLEGLNIISPAWESLGEEKGLELARRSGSLLARQERIVLTLREDLSFSTD